MLLWLKYQLISITFKDLRHSPKNEQNAIQKEVQIPCGRSTKQNRAINQKVKSFTPFSFWFQLFKIIEIERIN